MDSTSQHRRRTAALAALLLAASATAQQPSVASPATTPRPATLRNSIFLDPAHGGDDTGARFPNQAVEKDITLSLANRIRLQLNSFNLPVLLARETDDPTTAPLSADQRAGLANHTHAVLCIVLHATASGTGVHLITADLPPVAPSDPDHPSATPWLSAQAASLSQSERLADGLSTALARASLPVNRFHSNIRPLVSLTCPAVLIELAPLSRSQAPDNPAYQARVAQAVSTALLFFHNELAPAPAARPDAAPASNP